MCGNKMKVIVLVVMFIGVVPAGCGSSAYKEPDAEATDARATDASATDGRVAQDGKVGPVLDQLPQPVPDMALPQSCPCPLDSYCDLGAQPNTCVRGCRNHEHCSPGKYCDLGSQLCRVGCRTTADCQADNNPCTDLDCVAGSCTYPPNAADCPDDGNTCTADVCSGGSCTHPPTNEGTLCGKTLDCADFRCSKGVCAAKPFASGTGCPDDGDVCTSDACDGQGTCAHAAVPDGTECPHEMHSISSAKCFSGTCYPIMYRCCSYSTLYYVMGDGKSDTWDGTNSCGCSGNSMKWKGYYSGYPFDFTKSCKVCEDGPGICQSCFRLP